MDLIIHYQLSEKGRWHALAETGEPQPEFHMITFHLDKYNGATVHLIVDTLQEMGVSCPKIGEEYIEIWFAYPTDKMLTDSNITTMLELELEQQKADVAEEQDKEPERSNTEIDEAINTYCQYQASVIESETLYKKLKQYDRKTFVTARTAVRNSRTDIQIYNMTPEDWYELRDELLKGE